MTDWEPFRLTSFVVDHDYDYRWDIQNGRTGQGWRRKRSLSPAAQVEALKARVAELEATVLSLRHESTEESPKSA